ncbi:MAG: hypothetical protein JWM64_2075 [Frankiales bacterium]|nr:hypothetical protein [Frankiales bacterium]
MCKRRRVTTFRGLVGGLLVVLAAFLGFAGIAGGSLPLVLLAIALGLFGSWVGDLENLLR